MCAGDDPQEIVLDETAAANPEEIDIDDVEDASESDAVEQNAEAAKQDMAEDHGMFQSEALHNFSGVVQAEDNVNGSTSHTDQQQIGVSPALEAVMGTSQQEQN